MRERGESTPGFSNEPESRRQTAFPKLQAKEIELRLELQFILNEAIPSKHVSPEHPNDVSSAEWLIIRMLDRKYDDEVAPDYWSKACISGEIGIGIYILVFSRRKGLFPQGSLTERCARTILRELLFLPDDEGSPAGQEWCTDGRYEQPDGSDICGRLVDPER